MIGQTAVQQDQQQDGERFNRWFRHDPQVRTRSSRVCRPSEPHLSLSLSVSLSLGVVEQLLITGSKFGWTGGSDMLNVIHHVYFDSLKSNWTSRKRAGPEFSDCRSPPTALDQLADDSRTLMEESDLMTFIFYLMAALEEVSFCIYVMTE